MSGIIKGLGGWLKNSFIDFPGTVSTVLFFNRCNLECPYCHNPDFINGEVSQEELSQDVWGFLEKRKGVVEGVVLSGGEPTLFKSVIELSKTIKALGYKLKLDTNGLKPEVINIIKPDYLALDIKSGFEGYNKYLGIKYTDFIERLKESVKIVKGMGKSAEIRITAAPRIINDGNINDISLLIDGVEKVYLQKFSYGDHIKDMSFFEGIENSLSTEALDMYQKILAQKCGHCEIR